MKNLFLSANNIISPSEKEELNKWVLEKVVDKSFEKILKTVECVQCKKLIFEVNRLINYFKGNLNCPFCQFKYEQCIISGFPIRSEFISCGKCNKKAITSCWKEWIGMFKYCPWCRSFY